MPDRLAIVMPVFNEAEQLPLRMLQLRQTIGPLVPVYAVDGGSTDGSLSILNKLSVEDSALHVQVSAKGRAQQMNCGATAALNTGATCLLFLHADTTLPLPAWREFLSVVARFSKRGNFWGRFNVRIEGRSAWLPVVAWMMNQRSRLTRMATGDQGMFIHGDLFNRVGGFVIQPLMEDIEMSRALKRQRDAQFIPIRQPLITSGRRWDEQGAWSTIVLMWRLRFQYWRGESADTLLARYRDVRRRKKV